MRQRSCCTTVTKHWRVRVFLRQTSATVVLLVWTPPPPPHTFGLPRLRTKLARATRLTSLRPASGGLHG
eukprot:16714-Rhodomonas_salina.1